MTYITNITPINTNHTLIRPFIKSQELHNYNTEYLYNKIHTYKYMVLDSNTNATFDIIFIIIHSLHNMFLSYYKGLVKKCTGNTKHACRRQRAWGPLLPFAFV
jgi:hypothetical protein